MSMTISKKYIKKAETGSDIMRTNGLIKQLKNKNKQYGEIDGTLPFTLFILKFWRDHPFENSKRHLTTTIIPLVYNAYSGEMYIKVKTPFWRKNKGVPVPFKIQKLIQKKLGGIPTKIILENTLLAEGTSIIVESNEYDDILELLKVI
ncbi:hypothetical protein LCGC14_0176420 [marine sediment metagenome]|uniref:Uncharacterized protein n=1 Tax=marine sediment metagenome TaxID=412755 RepID=A0A0F9XU06_9ZZZZ